MRARPVGLWLAAATVMAFTASVFVAAPALVRAQMSTTRLTIIEGNEARFRAREVFLGQIITNEAVGRTADVSGVLLLLPDGSFTGESAVEVDLRNLTSDQAMRDNYIKNTTLQVGTYPTVRFVPTSTEGLLLPANGQVSFRMLGNLTVRDQTRPVVWDVNAEVTETLVTGTASTTITFQQFGLTKPTIEDIASIEDAVNLELDFQAVAEIPS